MGKQNTRYIQRLSVRCCCIFLSPQKYRIIPLMISQQSCLILWAPQAVKLKDWKLDQPLFCTFWKAWIYVPSFCGIRSCSCPSDGSLLWWAVGLLAAYGCSCSVQCFPSTQRGSPGFLLVWWWILLLINFASSFSASGELLQLQVSLRAGHLLLFFLLVLLPKANVLNHLRIFWAGRDPRGSEQLCISAGLTRSAQLQGLENCSGKSWFRLIFQRKTAVFLLVLLGLLLLFLSDAGSELMDFWQCWVNVWTRSEGLFPT